MPLYIRDDRVNDLAEQFRALSGARSKTEAVRCALASQISAFEQGENLAERIRRLQRKAAARGIRPDGWDDKHLMDELSGDL